jgi:hypothetical protein
MTQPAAQADPHKTLQGLVPSLATLAERIAAMDQAFDYRGDVTIELSDGRVIEGYIFDRRNTAVEPYVRLIPKDSDERVAVKYADIARLTFSGRDTAAGKSWETWVRKYQEKKAAGEKASIESEPLE